MDITEFDEQIKNKEQAIRIISSKITEYLTGLESLGVVDGYIYSAYKQKILTVDEVESIWKEKKEIHKK